MDQDDRPVGRLLTRREMLKLLTVFGATTAVGCGPRLSDLEGIATTAPTAVPQATAASVATTAPTVAVATGVVPTAAVEATTVPTTAATTVAAVPACVVRPEQTEGPYFVDEMLNRSDIRSDPSDGSVREGAPLALTFLVSRLSATTCAPLAGAQVDVWHCDADGVYSDVNDANTGSTVGQKFLRGYQLTDANGVASFTTIYPGWYPGRTVHIHFKIRLAEGGNNYEFTSQLYFDDAFTDQVYTRSPYNERGERTTRNNSDGIFNNGGNLLTLNVAPAGDGYAATFDIGMQM